MELGLCLEMIFTKDPLEERMRKAARAGLRNVEMWFVDLSWKQGPAELSAAAKGAGVRITNTVIGSPDGAVGGGLTDPAKRAAWLERTRMTLDFNRRAGHTRHDRVHGQRRRGAVGRRHAAFGARGAEGDRAAGGTGRASRCSWRC